MKRILLVLPFLLVACDRSVTEPRNNLVPTAASLSANVPTCTLTNGDVADRGVDQWGYNRCARIFNGTYRSWALEQGLPGNYAGDYSDDKLVMKWNAAWDTCNDLGTAEACAGAWTDNEENGKIAGGSGAVWHYKIQWSAVCAAGETPTDGGYCVWGSYEVLMDQGIDPNFGSGHIWGALAKPNGYGN